MKISKIAGYVAAGILTTSCGFKPASEKAMEHASKYLKGSELFVAQQRAADIRTKDAHNYSQDIFYWDSLLSVNREKQFIQKGIEHIRDSVNGNYSRKQLFQMPLEFNLTQDSKSIHDSIKNQVAQYYSGEEFLNLERKAPKAWQSEKYGISENHKTHYFGELAIKGAERKGYQEGLIEGRKALNH